MTANRDQDIGWGLIGLELNQYLVNKDENGTFKLLVGSTQKPTAWDRLKL